MKEIYGDLMDVTDGIICHQVNCRNEIGAGVSGAILKKYPLVGEVYHKLFLETKNWDLLLGNIQYVKVSQDLTVVNLFTQRDYGNAAKTGKVYTSVDHLVSALCTVCRQNPGKNIYIPGYIGCALAGADWNVVRDRLADLPITAVYLPNDQEEYDASLIRMSVESLLRKKELLFASLYSDGAKYEFFSKLTDNDLLILECIMYTGRDALEYDLPTVLSYGKNVGITTLMFRKMKDICVDFDSNDRELAIQQIVGKQQLEHYLINGFSVVKAAYLKECGEN